MTDKTYTIKVNYRNGGKSVATGIKVNEVPMELVKINWLQATKLVIEVMQEEE